jgi:hypothetical protein
LETTAGQLLVVVRRRTGGKKQKKKKGNVLESEAGYLVDVRSLFGQ